MHIWICIAYMRSHVSVSISRSQKRKSDGEANMLVESNLIHITTFKAIRMVCCCYISLFSTYSVCVCVVAKCLCELIHILNVRIVLNSKGDQFAFFLFMMPIFLQNTQNSQCSFLAQVSVHVRGIVMRHTPDIPEKFHKIKWNACTISLHFSISISFPFGYKEILANRIQFVIFRQQIEHTTFLRRDRRKFWKLKGK